MRSMKKLAVTGAAAIAIAASFSTSAFADRRSQDETYRDNRGSYQNRDRSYRDNERVTVEGKISNMTRQGAGYRVQLDRSGSSFWVPERSLRNRNNFRVGVSIRLGGIFRAGVVNVDVVDYPVAGGYGYGYGYGNSAAYVRGVVDGVDLRRGVLYIRDEYSRRTVTVDMYRADRRAASVDLNDLRRGDYVEVSGDWGRGGAFEAYRIESVRSGGYYR